MIILHYLILVAFALPMETNGGLSSKLATKFKIFSNSGKPSSKVESTIAARPASPPRAAVASSSKSPAVAAAQSEKGKLLAEARSLVTRSQSLKTEIEGFTSSRNGYLAEKTKLEYSLKVEKSPAKVRKLQNDIRLLNIRIQSLQRQIEISENNKALFNSLAKKSIDRAKSMP